MGFEHLIFYLFAGVAILGSLFVVVQPNPVYSVLSLVGAFFGLSGLYVLLDAPFVAVIQIIIYAGAVMVLFLFVVMLLNVPREDASEWDRANPVLRPRALRLGVVLALLLVAQLVWALLRTPGVGAGVGEQTAGVTSVSELGRVLFTDYMFPFEVTSILILTALLGAVVLARRQSE